MITGSVPGISSTIQTTSTTTKHLYQQLIENEFVKLKAEQLQNEGSMSITAAGQPSSGQQSSSPQAVLTSIAGLSGNLTATTVQAAAGADGQIVYCNLNDLELAAAAGGAGGEAGTEPGFYNLTSLASLAEASQSLQHQV